MRKTPALPPVHHCTCKNCGKVFTAKRQRDFCTTRCNKTWLQRKYRAGTHTTCTYRNHVVCADKTKCPHCGWNPEVEKARKEKLR